MFPIIIGSVLILSISTLCDRFGKLKMTRPVGVLLMVIALVMFGFTTQKIGEYLVYRYARDANLSSYNMPLWASAVSAAAPSIWEKAVLDKVDRVKEGRDLFPSDAKNIGYSVGPDGSDQGGFILYDPTNGVLSPGDILLGQ